MNDEFASSIREDLTFEELSKEVRSAVTQERDDKLVDQRNQAVEVCCEGMRAPGLGSSLVALL